MIKDNALKILREMNLDEKAGLCSGKDFWHLKSVERLGLPSIMVTDGPHGLRKQSGESDHIGLADSVKTTCFPTASATASSWDRDMLHEMGQAMAEECLQEDVAVLLGPGANIKRSPLCGRNFEYISEDPYLSGHLAASLIQGIQSRGIGTSLKHYVLNNQEQRRMTIDAVVDERAEREIYLRGFEIAVKESQPWTVMCSYNRVDGVYLSDHKRLLTDILKDEWGHTGLVLTDWGACNDRVQGIKAGMELEMPSSRGRNDARIVEAVKSGVLSEELLDKAVLRIIELILKCTEGRQEGFRYDADEHHSLAREIAGKSAVLLKNSGVLPIMGNQKITVIGEFAREPRYQGSGSSQINPLKIDSFCHILDEAGMDYEYHRGYSRKSSEPMQNLIDEACEAAARSEIVVIMAGLTDDFESEGFDRTHLRMPESHNELIRQVADINKNTVVILQNGAPVEMPWIHEVNAVLECYLSGQAGAGAAVDIIYGHINPSGKLSETFPLLLQDNPSSAYFPGGTQTVEYRESIYVGYRYYDTAGRDVLFPFGHGLSYTEFSYSDMIITERGDWTYDVSLNIRNTGDREGSEVVQLYVKNNDSILFKADKELRGFEKVYLKAGEEKRVSFTLNKRSFAYYNTLISDWHVDGGSYGIVIGSSSRDVRLTGSIEIKADHSVQLPDYREEAPGYYNLQKDRLLIQDGEFEALYGRKLPNSEKPEKGRIDLNTTLGDIRHKYVGRILYKNIMKNMEQMVTGEDGIVDEEGKRMISAVVDGMPLRAFAMLGGDDMPLYFAEGMVQLLNGRFLKGIMLLRKK